jgi:hypothetical protein
MLADEVLDQSLGLVVERVIGGAHIGEFGVAALIDDDAAGQDRKLRRDRAERAVGMPQLVAEVEQTAAIVARQRLVIVAEVRHVVDQRIEPLLLRPGHIAAGRVLDLTEIAAERDLLLVGNILAMKHQDRIAVHPGLDCHGFIGRESPAQIDPRDLADEDRMDLPDRDNHWRNLVRN